MAHNQVRLHDGRNLAVTVLNHAMNKPPIPPDLSRCEECAKIIGPHGGWFGPECMCALDAIPRRRAPLGVQLKRPTS
jgi:hypothetical protein